MDFPGRNQHENSSPRNSQSAFGMGFRRISRGYALITLALICCGAFSLMFWASRTDSAIMDELAHIPAGYGYVHNLDYNLNPEHPPLIKALAMLPVLFLQPNFPAQSAAWQTGVNAEWSMGTQFLYESGNNANQIIDTARIVPMLITILLILLIYFFARRLMGDWWALVPTFLFAFDPTVLAHGHYVTTDVGAACGITLAVFCFVRFIESPTRKNLWLAGLTFGIAQLTKFSAPLLIPLFVFLMLALWVREIIIHWNEQTAGRWRHLLRRGWYYLKNIIVIFAIAYLLVIYPVYALFTINYPIAKQVSDSTAILNLFANGPTPAGQMCNGMRCIANADIWMAHSPILRPFAEYLLGILMAFQRVDGGNTIYFLGHIVGSGGWIYFPLLYLLKEPIPSLVIVFVALALAITWMIQTLVKKRGRVLHTILDYIGVNFAEFAWDCSSSSIGATASMHH